MSIATALGGLGKLVGRGVKEFLSKRNQQTSDDHDGGNKSNDVVSATGALSDSEIDHRDTLQKEHVVSRIVDFETQGKINTTLTEIFATSLNTVVSSMDKKRRDVFLRSLSELAIIKAGSKHRPSDDLVWKRQLQSLVTDTQSFPNRIVFECNGDVVFSHRMWQMFFHAFYLLYYADLGEFEAHCHYLTKHEHNDIILFLHGLCRHRRYMSFAQTVKGGMAYFKKQNIWSKFFRVSSGCLPRQFLNLCRGARERNDNGLLAKSLPEEILLTGPIDKMDLISLGFVMSKIKRRIFLDVWMPNFLHCDLTDVLDLVERSSLQLRNLHLFRTTVSVQNAEAICRQIGSITDLVLKQCGLKSEVINILTTAVQRHHLDVFDLSGNRMEAKDFQQIGDCLHSVDALVLAECDVTAGEIPYLVTPMRQLKNPMKVLNLSGNNIGRSGFDGLINVEGDQPKIVEVIADPLHVNFQTSVTKEIDSNGGVIEVGGCRLTIPENAILSRTEIKLTLERPDEETCITPVLLCEPRDLQFQEKIDVTLPTCFIVDGDSCFDVKIQKLKEGGYWTDIDQIKYKYGKQIQFQTKHFCKLRACSENIDEMLVEKSMIFAMRPLANALTSQILMSIFIFDNLPHEKDLGGRENIHETIFHFRSSSNPDLQLRLKGMESLTIEHPLLKYKQIRWKPKVERQTLLKVTTGNTLALQEIEFQLIDVTDAENQLEGSHFYIPDVFYGGLQHPISVTMNMGTETHFYNSSNIKSEIARGGKFRHSTTI